MYATMHFTKGMMAIKTTSKPSTEFMLGTTIRIHAHNHPFAKNNAIRSDEEYGFLFECCRMSVEAKPRYKKRIDLMN